MVNFDCCVIVYRVVLEAKLEVVERRRVPSREERVGARTG